MWYLSTQMNKRFESFIDKDTNGYEHGKRICALHPYYCHIALCSSFLKKIYMLENIYNSNISEITWIILHPMLCLIGVNDSGRNEMKN